MLATSYEQRDQERQAGIAGCMHGSGLGSGKDKAGERRVEPRDCHTHGRDGGKLKMGKGGMGWDGMGWDGRGGRLFESRGKPVARATRAGRRLIVDHDHAWS